MILIDLADNINDLLPGWILSSVQPLGLVSKTKHNLSQKHLNDMSHQQMLNSEPMIKEIYSSASLAASQMWAALLSSRRQREFGLVISFVKVCKKSVPMELPSFLAKRSLYLNATLVFDFLKEDLSNTIMLYNEMRIFIKDWRQSSTIHSLII